MLGPKAHYATPDIFPGGLQRVPELSLPVEGSQESGAALGRSYSFLLSVVPGQACLSFPLVSISLMSLIREQQAS